MFFDVPFKSTLFAKGAQDIYNRCIEILSNLGLPSSHDRPSLFLEGFLLLQISGMVVCDLGNPVIGVGPPLQLRFKLRPCLPCRKSPSTNTSTLCFGDTISGLLGRLPA